jgi:hypothetical protein
VCECEYWKEREEVCDLPISVFAVMAMIVGFECGEKGNV